MSRHEIEDVLSSIRRLVAQDDGDSPGPRPGSHAPGKSGKLILSPACRVSSGAASVARLTQAPAAEPSEGAVESDEAPTTPATAPQQVDLVQAGTLEATIAELEAAIGARPELWEPECGDPPAFRSAAPAPGLDSSGPEEALDAADPALGDEAPMMSDAPTLPAAHNVHPFAAPTRPAPVDAPPRPAETAQTAPIPDDPRAEGPVRTRAPAPTPAQSAPPVEEVDDRIASVATGLLDEAALRDLVAEILRDELQGVLGQRITRNVRKMVRAEIAQALASRNLG